MRLAFFFTLVLTLVLPHSAHAVVHWTSCGACGTIDSGSTSIYAYSNDGLSYNSSQSTVTLQARYNVTDVNGNDSPGWTTLEIGYDTATGTGVSIEAFLIQVDPSTNNQIEECHVFSDTTHSTRTCTFSGLDFSKYVYYVHVAINRQSGQEYPTLDTLRIY
jgi:hypothetical protein